MLGAIIGDIVSSTRNWRNVETEKFEVLPLGSRFTDDTVRILAVAKWLMDDPAHSLDGLVGIMRDLGCHYHFTVSDDDFHSYDGPAKWVSPVGMYANSLDEALELAKTVAMASQNHPEEIKGAQAIAACVWMKKNVGFAVGEKMRMYLQEHFGYNLGIKPESINHNNFSYYASLTGSVPMAVLTFLKEAHCIRCLRLARSFGEDADAVVVMAASIVFTEDVQAIRIYPHISDFENRCRALLTPDLQEISDSFDAFISRPLYQSYYLGKSNLYAGEYPGDKCEEQAKSKIRRMTHFGVRHFIDLTEEGELCPYAHLLPKNCTYMRFPIRDFGVPRSIEDVERLLNRIRALSKRDDGYVYIHCWGGVGRTGTIVACYLAEDSFEATIKALRYRFSDMPKSAHRVTPDTKVQEAFIRSYVEGVAERKQRCKERVKDCIRGSLIGNGDGPTSPCI